MIERFAPEPIDIKYIAKDGIDLPVIQQTSLTESQLYGVGETADFNFTPLQAGIYNLHVAITTGEYWNQQWIVKDR